MAYKYVYVLLNFHWGVTTNIAVHDGHLAEAVDDIQCHWTKVGAQGHILSVQVGRNHQNIQASGIFFQIKDIHWAHGYIRQPTRNQEMQFIYMFGEGRILIEGQIAQGNCWNSGVDSSSATLRLDANTAMNTGQGE
jgi:hypothetical protein